MAEIKDTATELPWIRYDQNPYGVPLLDLRPITYQLGSDIEDVALKHLDSYSMEDGASFSGLSPETLEGQDRFVNCDLRYKTDDKLYPGSLFVPQTPEDRWAIFFDGEYIYFVRSWSRTLVAKAKVEQHDHEIQLRKKSSSTCCVHRRPGRLPEKLHPCAGGYSAGSRGWTSSDRL